MNIAIDIITVSFMANIDSIISEITALITVVAVISMEKFMMLYVLQYLILKKT